jgi:hypothetical protein
VVAIYLFNSGSISIDPDKIGTEESATGYLAVSAVIFFSLLYILHKKLMTHESDTGHFRE